MSELSDSAAGNLMIADYANVDTSGKINMIGGSIQFLGFDPATGLTAPFALWANISTKLVPGADSSASMEIILTDSDGNLVQLPGPAGPQPMRIAQNLDFRHSVGQGMQQPPVGFPGQANTILNFSNGLPLAVGMSYEWALQLDLRRIASVSFFVPGPPQLPVVG